MRGQQAVRNWEQVLSLIDQLEKRRVFDAEQAHQLRVRAQEQNLKRKALDVRSLTEAWEKIPPQEKKEIPPAAAGEVDFAKQIHPILEKNCVRCHGPKKQESNFRLDSREAALKGGDLGKDGSDIIIALFGAAR